jgi:hypothetical protein
MSYLETRRFVKQIECHIADFGDMTIAVEFWQTADYHVGIADCLNLQS